MNKYIVEMRMPAEQEFYNWLGDYVYAESKREAIVFAKFWLIEKGCAPAFTNDVEYRVKEV